MTEDGPKRGNGRVVLYYYLLLYCALGLTVLPRIECRTPYLDRLCTAYSVLRTCYCYLDGTTARVRIVGGKKSSPHQTAFYHRLLTKRQQKPQRAFIK